MTPAAKGAHTPGPWEVAYLDKHGQSVVKSQHTEICTCWHHSVGAIEKEMHANASLIAAAPDLFAALEQVRAMLADTLTSPKTSSAGQAIDDVIAQALEKAKGPKLAGTTQDASVRTAHTIDDAQGMITHNPAPDASPPAEPSSSKTFEIKY